MAAPRLIETRRSKTALPPAPPALAPAPLDLMMAQPMLPGALARRGRASGRFCSVDLFVGLHPVF